MNSVKVFAPASVANVGPGFDVFGFALKEPGDILTARKTSEPGVVIKKITGDNGTLPMENGDNSVSCAATSAMEKLGVGDEGLELELEKGMPCKSGLGSSGASAVAGAFAALKLFGNGASKETVLGDCIKAEGAVSGFHADNVAPSLLGGFVVIRSYEPLDVIKLRPPENLFSVLVTPDYEVSTKEAREMIPKEIPLKCMIKNTGNLAALISGILTSDLDLIGRSIDDCVVEPIRQKLIPGFDDVKKAALDAGAFGCGIPGSGPSIFAFADSQEKGGQIAKAMQEAFRKNNLESKKFVSRINNEGAKVL